MCVVSTRMRQLFPGFIRNFISLLLYGKFFHFSDSDPQYLLLCIYTAPRFKLRSASDDLLCGNLEFGTCSFLLCALSRFALFKKRLRAIWLLHFSHCRWLSLLPACPSPSKIWRTYSLLPSFGYNTFALFRYFCRICTIELSHFHFFL